ncbi:MAG: ribosome maturation factor RimM [Erysipelothrix sp.]|nr:ribosome maturation factor RimM [Erysipelothrix sp.]
MKIKIGIVQKPFGIRGEVKIKPTTDFAEDRYKVGNTIELVLNDVTNTYKIESLRHHQGSLLVKFVGLDSLNDVEFFHRAIIQIERDAMHELDEGEYYFVDLVGCDVICDDINLGKVTEVMDLPAHPVLRVKSDDEDKLIPFVDPFIKDVSMDTKTITINFMEGLY